MVKAEQDLIQFETKHNAIINHSSTHQWGLDWSLLDFTPEQLVIPCSEVRRLRLLLIKHYY